jgi:hypothetical protein
MAGLDAGAGARYADPGLECDIVMKGGITSGVVYPGAGAPQAADYRFRSIGGTSAGAIAAAIVAAAEHRRRRGDPAGFEAVEALAGELAGPPGGRPQLLKLFQPDRATRPLFCALLGFQRGGHLRAALGVLRWFPLAPALGALACAAAIVLGVLGVLGLPWVVAACLAAILLTGIGLAVTVARAAVGLKDNDFGLCTLGPGSVGDGPALTAWLHAKLQDIAGRAPGEAPLTFADLWGVEPGDPAARQRDMAARSADAEQRAVDLQMMTTDLTHGRPWRLPAPFQRYDPTTLEYGGELLFRPDELARFFPPDVVEHLERSGEPIGARRAAHLPDGGAAFRRFVIGPDLPVLVATRMSLSFPGLISAVPLWNLDFADPARVKLERVVFSDGGITSNFPVHFFDAPLPRRPTFGLHLTALPAGMPIPIGPDQQDRAVSPPVAAARQAPEEPREIASMAQFLVAIKDALQNWRDNLQARQPGFRDRMVHVGLGRGEGGLTLTMDRDKVLDLSARGAAAGRVLVGLFAQPGDAPGTPWNVHRFVRFRVASAVTEGYLASFGRAWEAQPADGISQRYPERVALAGPGGVGPYLFVSDAQKQRALADADAYDRPLPPERARELGNGAPRPPSTLRVVPPT